jgi:hypothetical protein
MAVVANVASIEDIPHVSLKQHQHCSEAVIGIEKSDRDLEASRHLEESGCLEWERILVIKDGTMQVRLGNFCRSICLVSAEQ